jgi:hypothetical protein
MENNIFTINDRIKYNNKNYTISRFEVLNEKCLVGLIGMQCLVNLNEIEHSKPVLFNTFDGVDTFEGEGYWYVNKEIDVNSKPYYNEAWGDNTHQNHLTFSTKEAAEEYVLFNAPKLSINDVVTAYDISNRKKEILINIVKTRL